VKIKKPQADGRLDRHILGKTFSNQNIPSKSLKNLEILFILHFKYNLKQTKNSILGIFKIYFVAYKNRFSSQNRKSQSNFCIENDIFVTTSAKLTI